MAIDSSGLTADFLGSLLLERGLSRHTIDAYRSDVTQHLEFLAARGVDPFDAGRADLQAWLDQLAGGSAGAGGKIPFFNENRRRKTSKAEFT